MTIESDQYKYEYCSITNDECDNFSCDRCNVADEKDEENKEAEHVDFCTFQSRTTNGITLEMNLHNTIAKCKTVDEFFIYTGDRADIKEYNKVKGAIGNDTIEKEYPNYNTIIKELKLKTCTESYYLQTYPLIAVHDDFVLVIAPRIYNKE